LCFNKKGDQLASCSAGLLNIWTTDDYQLIKSVKLANNSDQLEYSPDDQYIMVFPYASSNVTVINASDFSKEVYSWNVEKQGLYSYCFSKDGKYWALGGYDNNIL